tara:strand:+ start:3089 stop:5431 length:2343 start_codon:yes stop_codon:yes gene_type:complete
MKKLIPIFLIFLTIIFFKVFIDKFERNKFSLNNIKKCNELNYDNHKLNSVKNLSEIEIDLIIDEERKWKKIILNTHVSEFEDKSFTYDAKFTNATLRIKNKFGFDCILKAKIKPHGDLLDHYRDYGPGYDPIYAVPSLKVKLKEGNIFGIVEFRLLIPKTRQKGNEIFATTLFKELGFYAPRTAYVKLNYNNKKYKFLFQEKLVKEFLEHNSLQEGLFYAGDERFSFKYENVSEVNGKVIEEKEIGISKFRITESKFLKKNQIFTKPAIETLQALNVSSHFYTSDIKQSWLIDYFTTQKDSEYKNLFKNLPEFDAMMYALGAEHGLSRDDRRFYFDVLNKSLIPIYNDGAVRIFSGDQFGGPNIHSSVAKQLKRNKKFSNSAKVGAFSLVKKIDDIDIGNLQKTLNQKGLSLSISDLNLVLQLIKENLTLLSNLSDNQINKVSNSNQHPIRNKEAIKKEIKASYLFTDNDIFKKCDLLLNNCVNVVLTSKDLRKALKQDLKDIDGANLIFLGDFNIFDKNKIIKENKIISKNKNVFLLEDLNFKIFGNVNVDIDEINKKIKFLKKDNNSRVLFFNSNIKDWSLEFVDLINNNNDIIRRDTNGLSGCLNIYDSSIENLKVYTNNTKCEDALNLVRTDGSIGNLKISNALFDGLDADFSNLNIENIEVINSGNDCMDFSYGQYFLNKLNLSKCSDKAISTGEGSNLEVNNFIINESLIGIASKDSASVNSSDGSIKNVDKCFSLYKKKQEFNGGLLQYKNLKCKGYNDFAFKDNYSKLIELN